MADWFMVGFTALSVLIIPVAILLSMLWAKVYNLEREKVNTSDLHEAVADAVMPLQASINQLMFHLMEKK